MRTALAALVIGGSLVFGGGGSVNATPNNCQGWAIEGGYQGRVRDSVEMHLLGCDDGPLANARYRADQGYCAKIARQFARQGYRSWVVAKAVNVSTNDRCTVFEDGTYSDGAA
jgi:hypothetical protein